MKPNSRRKFIKTSAQAGIIAMAGLPALGSILPGTTHGQKKQVADGLFDTGFEQQPLTFAYNALEPWIDTMTMDIHYNKHAGAYCKNLKEAALAEKADTTKPVEDLLKKISTYSVKMRNNAGGHFNHELFWKLLTPVTGTQPSAPLESALRESFGSVEAFQKQFTETAKSRFGSGWAWLASSPDRKLQVFSTPNQDNPLMDLSEQKGFPLIGLDVWEHAYYLKYQNRRAEYIDNFWKVLNWKYVNDRYSSLG